MIGVGEGAKPSRAQQVVLDLLGDPQKNLALIQAALDAERADGVSEGRSGASADLKAAEETMADVRRVAVDYDTRMKQIQDEAAMVNEQNKALTVENEEQKARIAFLEEENANLRLRPPLPDAPPATDFTARADAQREQVVAEENAALEAGKAAPAE